MKKKLFILSIIAIILIFCSIFFYNYFLNPLDEVGYRCQTGYNQSKHTLATGEEIDILVNSCFVADCCMYTSSFRTKMPYEELKTKAEELEIQLNKDYPNKGIKVTIQDGNLYREYTISYQK